MLETRAYRFAKGADAKRLKQAVADARVQVLAQVADASVAENESFLELIVAQTVEAKKQGVMLARKEEIDLLLRLACESQIDAAIAKAGAKDAAEALLVLAGERRLLQRFERAIPKGAERVGRRPLTAAEAERVERAALLNAERA